MKLIPHGATPTPPQAIRSLIWVGTLDAPEPCQCSTCQSLRVRLALELFRGEPAISRFVRHFTTYPQVISKFCNICEFEPPCAVTHTSLCPWVAHRVSGLLHATFVPRRELNALFGLAFAAAPPVSGLAWPRKVTRWVILQEARPQTGDLGLPPKAPSSSDCS
jgi:hypothetical protein